MICPRSTRHPRWTTRPSRRGTAAHDLIMCGIALIWDQLLSRPELAATAGAMSHSLRHRGPDGHGLACIEGAPLAMAHQRLAIQGLGEQGSQPMIHPDALGVLNFNGELFDFDAIRASLLA